MIHPYTAWFYVPESLEHARFTDRPPVRGRVLAELQTVVPLSVLNTWDVEGRCVLGWHTIKPNCFCTSNTPTVKRQYNDT